MHSLHNNGGDCIWPNMGCFCSKCVAWSVCSRACVTNICTSFVWEPVEQSSVLAAAMEPAVSRARWQTDRPKENQATIQWHLTHDCPAHPSPAARASPPLSLCAGYLLSPGESSLQIQSHPSTRAQKNTLFMQTFLGQHMVLLVNLHMNNCGEHFHMAAWRSYWFLSHRWGWSESTGSRKPLIWAPQRGRRTSSAHFWLFTLSDTGVILRPHFHFYTQQFRKKSAPYHHLRYVTKLRTDKTLWPWFVFPF